MGKKNIFYIFLNKYNIWCQEKPLKSSIINTFTIMTTGDILI